MDKEVTAVRLEERVWDAVKEMLLDTDVLRQAYHQAQQLDVENRSRSRTLLDGYYRSAGKLEQQLNNLTRAYTDPDIRMTKTEYLAQRVQLDRDLIEARAKIEEIEAIPMAVPTQSQFEDLESFAQKVRERIDNEDWDPTPESKRQVLELLHAKVILSKDGSGKVTGWFGETIGFSYTRR
jgi:DNA repair ATPase RecN